MNTWKTKLSSHFFSRLWLQTYTFLYTYVLKFWHEKLQEFKFFLSPCRNFKLCVSSYPHMWFQIFFKCFSPFFITSTQMMKLIFLAIMIFFFQFQHTFLIIFFGLKNSFFSPSCEIIVLEDKVRTIWNVICHF